MAHGQPDFGMYAQKETVFGLTDMGELAARLGSINTFDRRGDVIWFDDFELPQIRWNSTSLGVGSSTYLSTVNMRSGVQSRRMESGPAAGRYTKITRMFQFFTKSKIGIEISFSMGAGASKFGIELIHYDGTNSHTAKCYHYNNTNDLVITTPAGDVIVASLALHADLSLFHTLKLVIDSVTNKYVRVLLDAEVYDISDEDMVAALDATPRAFDLEIKKESLGAAAAVSYADDCILTQNEP